MSLVITSTGISLPEQIISNAEIEQTALKQTGIKSNIVKLTGIKERRRAAANIASSDIAIDAARMALDAAGSTADEIDLVILSTTSPDMLFPSTACIVQGKIGASNAAAFDLSASCSGFMYGLAISNQFLSNGNAGKILLISAEVKSRFLDRADHSTYPLFGDGAAAMLLEYNDLQLEVPVEVPGSKNLELNKKSGLIDIKTGSDGTRSDIIKLEINYNSLSKGQLSPPLIKMSGARLFRSAVHTITKNISRMLEKNAVSISDVDHFIFHQANIRILDSIAKKLAIPLEKVHITLDRFGNTSSASIPITLHQGISTGRIQKNDLLMFASFGGGITWGTALLRV